MTKVKIDGLLLDPEIATNYQSGKDELQAAFQAGETQIANQRASRMAEIESRTNQRLAEIRHHVRRSKRIVWTACGTLTLADLVFFTWLMGVTP